MIAGYADERGLCRVEITVAGIRRQTTLEALIDTGFDGWLCLPIGVAIQIGLELRSVQVAELADGTEVEQLVFVGEVTFGDRQRWVDVTLTSSQEAMIGTGLLLDSVMTVDFANKVVTIE